MDERQWQPIETAPRDGQQMLLWSAAWDMSWGIVIGHFEGGVWLTSEGEAEENDPGYDPDEEVDEDELEDNWDDESNMGPTHWMPLPRPPESSS